MTHCLFPLYGTSVLMLMDGGGGNSSRHYIFKQDLQALVDKLGIDIRVAHYPASGRERQGLATRVSR